MRTKEIRFRLNKIAHMSPFNANRLTATRKVPVCAVRPSVPTRREGEDFREYRELSHFRPPDLKIIVSILLNVACYSKSRG
jgi:hypothetical protein